MNFIKAFCRRVLRLTVFSVPFALARVFFSYETIVARLNGPQYAFAFRSFLTDRIDQETRKVFYSKLEKERAFDLFTPNQTCLFRQETFHLKEPEIIDWIDAFGGDGTFFEPNSNSFNNRYGRANEEQRKKYDITLDKISKDFESNWPKMNDKEKMQWKFQKLHLEESYLG